MSEESGEEVVPTPRNFVLIFVLKIVTLFKVHMTGAVREKAQISLAALKQRQITKNKTRNTNITKFTSVLICTCTFLIAVGV